VILLDTSVLSAVLRRKAPASEERRVAERLQALLNTGQRIGVPGIVVQELLSGIRETAQFEAIKRALLRGYPVVTATVGDHVLAADVANKCRRRGVAVSSVDALIAALAINAKAQLFALDEDFAQIAKVTPLRLFGG
jgi:predicted nucleic acid-binding protein